MTLVDEGTAAATPDPTRKKVAILLFDGVEIVDYTGPYEMFGAAGCDVYTVAESTQPVTTAMGMVVVPKYSFADAPQPDVLVVPGGGVKAASQSAPTLKYVKDATAGAQHTLSVCNGAFILANAGLLDGLTATTTAGNIDRLAQEFPKTRVVRDQRVVDNGKIVTAGGLSAGIDGALHVISKVMGEGTAQSVALVRGVRLAARWRIPAGHAGRSMKSRTSTSTASGHWDVVGTHGTTSQWELVFAGSIRDERGGTHGQDQPCTGRAGQVDPGARVRGSGGWRPGRFSRRAIQRLEVHRSRWRAVDRHVPHRGRGRRVASLSGYLRGGAELLGRAAGQFRVAIL